RAMSCVTWLPKSRIRTRSVMGKYHQEGATTSARSRCGARAASFEIGTQEVGDLHTGIGGGSGIIGERRATQHARCALVVEVVDGAGLDLEAEFRCARAGPLGRTLACRVGRKAVLVADQDEDRAEEVVMLRL